MQMVLSEQKVLKCAQAYALFVKAKGIIKKGENYVEGLNLNKCMGWLVKTAFSKSAIWRT